MVRDIFDNKIICAKCTGNKEMVRGEIERNGFKLRIVKCPSCNEQIAHPSDLNDYEQFIQLKNKTFKVKLRLVGNSYAVSIPKEIVDFVKEQERMIDDMVSLCFNNARRLSLMFGE